MVKTAEVALRDSKLPPPLGRLTRNPCREIGSREGLLLLFEFSIIFALYSFFTIIQSRHSERVPCGYPLAGVLQLEVGY